MYNYFFGEEEKPKIELPDPSELEEIEFSDCGSISEGIHHLLLLY